MTTYYIDPSSPTNGTGTFASPFNTWASVTWAAGNTYLQKAGTTQTGYRILITVGGTSLADRVIIGSYDPSTGAKTTNGLNRAILNGAGTPQTIRVNSGVNFVWIDNFEVYGTDGTTGTKAIGIYFGNGATLPSNDIEISNCYVHDINGDAFADNIDSDGIQGFGNRTIIRNNLIERIPTDGIWLQGSDYKVTDNIVRKVSLKGIQGDCIQINGDTDLRNDRGYIARNYLDHSNKNSKQVIISGGITFSSKTIIENNFCIMAPDDGRIQTTCIFVEASDSIVRYNYCIGGYRGILSSASGTNVLVYSNITLRNQIGIATNTTGIRVIGNVVSYAVIRGIELDVDTTASALNNLIINCLSGLRIHGSGTEDYNSYFNNGTDRVLAGGVANWGTHSIFTDPKVNSNFRPNSSSPLIAAGTFNYLQDKNSTTFWTTPSIGAYEYVRPRNALTQVRTFR